MPRCTNPLTLLHPHDRFKVITVPCGRCIACRLRYASSWATRCLMEYKSVGDGCFLTLTYDDDHNPIHLRKRDLQLFFKRFRHTVGKFRYFACGEYGSDSLRPHYHCVLFGLPLEHDVFATWHVQGRGRCGHLADWPYGLCFVGAVSEASCLYVAKYAVKGYHLPVDGLEAPFLVMSRRPGIGRAYVMRYGDRVRSGRDPVLRYQGNFFPSLPQYVKDILAQRDLMVDFDLTPIRQQRNAEIDTALMHARYELELLRSLPPGELPDGYQRRINNQRALDLAGHVR